MRGYVIGRIGTQWYLWGYYPFPAAKEKAQMADAGYSNVHCAEGIDSLSVRPTRRTRE
jgi:hypothetical protein